MAGAQRSVAELVGEARAAVRQALERSRLSRAWELLQDRDADGGSRGTLPYTDAALKELASAHAEAGDDPAVIHHLAIARHARAWDLELRGDGAAPREWEEALGHWRAVGASGEFWKRLEAKLKSCDPQADVALVARLRRDLLEQLLEVHVDFVRHYCEADTPGRAVAHVEIVRRARIPPAVKARLVEKVFQAMTGSVAAAREAREYDAALVPVERFLALFPDHLPALRLHAEVCKEWTTTLSHKDHWPQVASVAARAEPHARRLAGHPALASEPLARTALEELAFELALRAHDRGATHFVGRESGRVPGLDRDGALEALALGVAWGRLGCPVSRAEAPVRTVGAYCALAHAFCLHEEALDVRAAEASPRTRLDAAVLLYRQAVGELDDAVAWKPGDDDLARNRQVMTDNLAGLEAERDLFESLGNWGA